MRIPFVKRRIKGGGKKSEKKNSNSNRGRPLKKKDKRE
jgi:hypothetical protein